MADTQHRFTADQAEQGAIDLHLSQIQTRWSNMVSPESEIHRYYEPVYYYLLGILARLQCDDKLDRAHKLTIEFAERFKNAEFQRHADAGKGRFRDYLKTSLRNMVRDRFRGDKSEAG